MSVSQELPRDERGMFQGAEPKGDIDAVGNMVDKPIRNQNLHPDLGVACLERCH